ncbi:MAG: transporter substrate-binding domain-containing protein [Cypionkella sp.]
MTLTLTRRASFALAAVLMTSAITPAFADVLADVTKAGVLKVGIFEDFPPFASLNTSMKIEGYDTEVADKLAAALGVKAELVGITGQNRIPFLTEGKVDVLLSIGFSDERAQVVDFTAPYAPYYIVVMGPKDIDVTDAAGLSGKTIAVNKGTLEDTEVTKVAPADANIQRYADYSGVISSFLSGQSQLMVVGNDVGATILAQNPAIEPVEKFKLLSSPSQMAVKKGETAFKDALDKAVTDMKADGSLNELAVKWLKAPLVKDF